MALNPGTKERVQKESPVHGPAIVRALEMCQEALRGIFNEHINQQRRNALPGNEALPQGPCICIHCEAFKAAAERTS